jgi:hypothetical protein
VSPRHTKPIDHRSPPKRREATASQRWLAAIREAQETRADLAVTVGIDVVTLVDSRTVEDASHEVTVWTNPDDPKDRRAIKCSCWPSKQGQPCPHRAYVAIRLWEEDMGADLSQAGAIALVSTLMNRYLDAPKRPREKWWLGSADVPETRYAGPEPVVA